ncbi:MAG TPA: hypothetical protein PLF48_10620 [Chitinophagales bacterium]|nr:hypothetical protein [Chitinophagales bacterium]
MLTSKDRIPFITGIGIALFVNFFSWQNPFFWDTLLTSTITQHYYENGFHNLILPTQIDAGHPPFFYVCITLFYKIIGKNLFTAHLAMLPIILSGVIAFILLLRYFGFTLLQQVLAILTFFAIPHVLTQYSLVSYDATLLSLYLWALWAILKAKNGLLTVLLILILAISLRGMVLWGALVVTTWYIYKIELRKFLFPFVISIFVITCWYIYHHWQCGWWFSTPAAGWANQRGWADFPQLLKNIFSIARCFFDLGIVVLSLLFVISLFTKKYNKQLVGLVLIPALLLSLSLLPFSNPVNHRYYLIVYVLLLLNVLHFMNQFNFRWSLMLILFLVFGNKMIYPVPISNAWDCTMLHRNYFTTKKAIFRQMDEMGISRTQTGTTFPLDAGMHQSDMTADTVRMINVNGSSLDQVKYVLFSNVCNDFSNDQIEEIKTWNKLYRVSDGQVYIELYEK